MRGSRFVPLVVVTATVATVVGVVIARQGMHATLAEPPARATYALGGMIVIILVAAVATLPLVMLLAYLRGRPPRVERLAAGRRRLALAVGRRRLARVLLIVLLGGLVLLCGVYLGEFIRTAVMIGVPLVIGLVGYGLVLTRLVRWLDERLPARYG